ncbi:MAG: hypothetical protein GWN58_20570 [Anaerolineae bacterium]|nr:hypothetical protein [Anaerolineae bacterium]
MRLDHDVKAQAGFAFKEARKETPALGQTLAIIPLAMGVGFVVLFGAALVCLGLKMNARGSLVLGGAAMIGAVLFLFRRVIVHELYMVFERITGQDLNQDGYVGEPPKTSITFQASERTSWMAELPASPALILEWGEAALSGRSLGYRQWGKRFAMLPDGSDGAQRYSEFRDALVRGMLAVERGKHGIALTERGVQQFTEHVAQRPEATPLLDA